MPQFLAFFKGLVEEPLPIFSLQTFQFLPFCSFLAMVLAREEVQARKEYHCFQSFDGKSGLRGRVCSH